MFIRVTTFNQRFHRLLPRLMTLLVGVLVLMLFYNNYLINYHQSVMQDRLGAVLFEASIQESLTKEMNRLIGMDVPVVEDVGEEMTRMWIKRKEEFCQSEVNRQNSTGKRECQTICDQVANFAQIRTHNLIVIPYRDRFEHLNQLIPRLEQLLNDQKQCYLIVVVEQAGIGPFNKGKLMNAAFVEAIINLSFPFHCITLHDVDLLPLVDDTPYNCPSFPRHSSVIVDKFDNQLPYVELVGGILSMPVKDFLRVNGFSNLYWGWGAEDDDIYERMMANGIVVTRLNLDKARFKMLHHSPSPALPAIVRSHILQLSKARHRLDGINSLNYSMIATTWVTPGQLSNKYPIVHMLVDVGLPPFPFVMPDS